MAGWKCQTSSFARGQLTISFFFPLAQLLICTKYMVKEDMPLSQDVEIALKLRVAIISAELGSYKNCVQPFIEHLLWARHWAKCFRCIFLLGYQDLDDTASKGQVELISFSSTWMSSVEKLIIGTYMGVFGHAGFAIRKLGSSKERFLFEGCDFVPSTNQHFCRVASEKTPNLNQRNQKTSGK